MFSCAAFLVFGGERVLSPFSLREKVGRAMSAGG